MTKPCTWVRPRPHSDPVLRHMTHGPIQPAEAPPYERHLARRHRQRVYIALAGFASIGAILAAGVM